MADLALTSMKGVACDLLRDELVRRPCADPELVDRDLALLHVARTVAGEV